MDFDFKNILNQISEKFNLNLQLKNRHVVFKSEKFTRLHITADFIGDKNNFEMFLATIIGTGEGGTDFNKILFPKLLNSQESINRINEIYHGCIFQRCVRLNTFKTNLFFHIADFFSLEDYLKIFHHIKITRPHYPKANCITDLIFLNATGDFQKLQRYDFKYYHWLEYLRIGEFVGRTKNFDSFFKRHIEGAQLFSSIQHKKFRWRE